MQIHANTKISSILSHNSEALEAIVSLAPAFSKLRNPILRKIAAARTTVAEACKIGNCQIEDFVRVLTPLGFEFSNLFTDNPIPSEERPFHFSTDELVEFDVRSILESGKDPLNHILEKVKFLKDSQVLKIVNTFKPVPLVRLLESKGFESFTEQPEAGLFYTYFHKITNEKIIENIEYNKADDWDMLVNSFQDKIKYMDVRALEMPQPMINILYETEQLKEGHALYIYHKRVPVFLLPELKDKKLDYRIKEISENETHILIFK